MSYDYFIILRKFHPEMRYNYHSQPQSK